MSLCHYAIMPLAAIMPLCTAYNIQHTTSHHAYDIYTSTTSSMQVCNNNLKCQHFSRNCADVLNVGSVPTPGCDVVCCMLYAVHNGIMAANGIMA